MSPVSILMVVVLPAPFGPEEAEDLAASTSNDTPRTASTFLPEKGFRNVLASLAPRGHGATSRRIAGPRSSGAAVWSSDASSVLRRRRRGQRRRGCSGSAACGEPYSWSLYWIFAGQTPRSIAAFEVEPPHASSVFRMA